MEHLRQLATMWSWLPAFRAVAETENLQEAGRLLHVSPSSLSRAVRLLEVEMGVLLFHRHPRLGLGLTPAGRELVATLRDSMRRLHDVVASARTAPMPLRIEAPAVLLGALVLPAVQQLRLEVPDLRVHLRHDDEDQDPVGRLLRGEIDLSVCLDHVTDPQISVDPLDPVTFGLYCGQAHPFASSPPTLADVQAAAFVVIDGSGDRWPREMDRQVAVEVPDAAMAVRLMADGAFVAFLPDALVAGSPQAARTRRLGIEIVPPAPAFAIRRPTLGDPGPVERLVSLLQTRGAGRDRP